MSRKRIAGALVSAALLLVVGAGCATSHKPGASATPSGSAKPSAPATPTAMTVEQAGAWYLAQTKTGNKITDQLVALINKGMPPKDMPKVRALTKAYAAENWKWAQTLREAEPRLPVAARADAHRFMVATIAMQSPLEQAAKAKTADDYYAALADAKGTATEANTVRADLGLPPRKES